MYKYYDIHVFFRRNEGYSFGLIAADHIINEEDIIAEAVRQQAFTEEGDEDYVDMIDEMTENEFNSVYN